MLYVKLKFQGLMVHWKIHTLMCQQWYLFLHSIVLTSNLYTLEKSKGELDHIALMVYIFFIFLLEIYVTSVQWSIKENPNEKASLKLAFITYW